MSAAAEDVLIRGSLQDLLMPAFLQGSNLSAPALCKPRIVTGKEGTSTMHSCFSCSSPEAQTSPPQPWVRETEGSSPVVEESLINTTIG